MLPPAEVATLHWISCSAPGLRDCACPLNPVLTGLRASPVGHSLALTGTWHTWNQRRKAGGSVPTGTPSTQPSEAHDEIGEPVGSWDKGSGLEAAAFAE